MVISRCFAEDGKKNVHKNYNARTQQMSCPLELFSSDTPVAIQCCRGFLVSLMKDHVDRGRPRNKARPQITTYLQAQNRDFMLCLLLLTCTAMIRDFCCVVFHLVLSYVLFYSTPDLVKYYLHAGESIRQLLSG